MSASSLATFAAQDASAACLGFADEVGGESAGPVRLGGAGTQSVQPSADTSQRDASIQATLSRVQDAREVCAPSGIVSIEPEELIVRCNAGTSWSELDAALAERGLLCALDPVDQRATVGGILAVGRNGIRRNRNGQVRDLLLEARYISAQGICIKAGAPVVKNVTGYDLCRLLVGSWGTLGFLSEVVLRCRPRPAVQVWLRSKTVEPFSVHASLVSPGAVLWDGTCTHVLLEGSAVEVDVGRSRLGAGWSETSPPKLTAFGYRASLRNSVLRTWTEKREFSFEGGFLAEIGVGVVHFSKMSDAERFAPEPLSSTVLKISRDLKAAFDPTGRLNPGVQPC